MFSYPIGGLKASQKENSVLCLYRIGEAAPRPEIRERAKVRENIMAFYIRGLMAIISEWLKNDCTDSITYVTGVIQQCVKMPQSETTNAV